MENVIYEKFIDLVKKDICGVTLRKETDVEKVILAMRYDGEKEDFNYNFITIVDGDIKEVNGSFTDFQQLVYYINEVGLINELITFVEGRISKEKRFLELRKELIGQLDQMNLSEEQIKVLLGVITQVTQLSEVVGMANRVCICSTPDYWEEVRVTDDSRWNDSGEVLHLQLVQAFDDPAGRMHHGYPELSFEEIVGKILNSSLIINDNEKLCKNA